MNARSPSCHGISADTPVVISLFGSLSVSAVPVPALSFLPLTGEGTDLITRGALALAHLAVAGVLIPAFVLSSPGFRRDTDRTPQS